MALTEAPAPPSAEAVDRVPSAALIPRVALTLRGGRAGRTEAVDVPADTDGLQHLAEWLNEREGWSVMRAEVIP